MLPIECSKWSTRRGARFSTKHQSRTTVPRVGIAEATSKSTTAAENIAQAAAPLRLSYMVCLLNSREATIVKKSQ
jgi:hypothetical protein